MARYFDRFESKKYWNQNEEKINQHFYVSLCLYQSACSDFLIGLDLSKDNRLSWTIISSYYSIMHSLRAIIFMAVGDFPKEHSALNKVFFDNENRNSNNRSVGQSWLREFDSNIPNLRRFLDFFNRNHLAEYYTHELQFKDSVRHFENIGKLLYLTRKIRNNSNYEALIIAHEKNHSIVSDSFIRLSNTILRAAEYCISIATKCIKQHIDFNEAFSRNRIKLKWFAYEFFLTRFRLTIETRSKRKYLQNKVFKFPRSIIRDFFDNDFTDFSETVLEDYLEIEQDISLKIFGEKRNLMNTFRNKVTDLEEIVNDLKILRR